jgi:hypothetical protein
LYLLLQTTLLLQTNLLLQDIDQVSAVPHYQLNTISKNSWAEPEQLLLCTNAAVGLSSR